MDKKPAPRTDQQNKSLWLYAQLCATALNDAGLDIETVLKNYTMELEWDKNSFMDIAWRTAQKRLLGKESTRDLNKQEDVTRVYEACNRFLAQLGIHVPFPAREEMPESLKGYSGERVAYPSEEGNIPDKF